MSKRYSRLVTGILVVSLLFNVFFVGAYLKTRKNFKRLKTPEGRVELIAGRLDLSEEQKDILSEKLKNLRRMRKELKKNNRAEIEAFWQEIAKDNPDPQKLKELLRSSLTSRQEFTLSAIESLKSFLQTLSPSQRQVYVKFMRKKMGF
ncbi:MAG: periplasmic heavy metal sensor [Candidatus Omnitrophica bacterium]|nr:periplasmic heavy metal sensor [Candidatus Omnitrophota bacterium]MBD3268626.1 periplasmic heavy metal sensor [Candidatus Omnitrophota bacterium]